MPAGPMNDTVYLRAAWKYALGRLEIRTGPTRLVMSFGTFVHEFYRHFPDTILSQWGMGNALLKATMCARAFEPPWHLLARPQGQWEDKYQNRSTVSSNLKKPPRNHHPELSSAI